MCLVSTPSRQERCHFMLRYEHPSYCANPGSPLHSTSLTSSTSSNPSPSPPSLLSCTDRQPQVEADFRQHDPHDDRHRWVVGHGVSLMLPVPPATCTAPLHPCTPAPTHDTSTTSCTSQRCFVPYAHRVGYLLAPQSIRPLDPLPLSLAPPSRPAFLLSLPPLPRSAFATAVVVPR